MEAVSTKPDQVERRARNATPQPLQAAQISNALLKLDTAAALSGVSVPTLYRKAASDPTFPKLIKMGKRCTRIRAGELMIWLDSQGGA